MENGFAQDLLTWISDNPGWAGFAIFLIAFVESLVVIGFLLPGIFILFGVGALIGLARVLSWPGQCTALRCTFHGFFNLV